MAERIPKGMRFAVCFHDPAVEKDHRVKYFPDAVEAREMAAEMNRMLGARSPQARTHQTGEMYYVCAFGGVVLPWLEGVSYDEPQGRKRRQTCTELAETAVVVLRGRLLGSA